MSHRGPIQYVVLTAALLLLMVPCAFADVLINVMAVNGSPTVKETPVKYSLPPELKADDILDTSGLDLDYNVNDASYYVHGNVSLQPKESKTFKIRVKDIWKVTPDQVTAIQKRIEDGYNELGKVYDQAAADILKDHLNQKLNYIVEQQTSRADSVERRIDSFRTYTKEVRRIEMNALAVDYWRSKPGDALQEKIIRFKIEVENTTDKVKPVKQKHYLPTEVRPENLVEYEGFEVRYDQAKRQAFLYKEEDFAPHIKKSYSIGIRDIWYIHQKDIDYLRRRADYAWDFLKSSQYAVAAKSLYDRAGVELVDIETSQKEEREIKAHISAYRVNQKIFEDARADVEELEKILAIYRENLEKSKVDNVLQKVQSLKSVAGVAKQMFDKKPTASTAWKFIGWILAFVAFLTTLSFVLWTIRSRNKKLNAENLPPAKEEEAPVKK